MGLAGVGDDSGKAVRLSSEYLGPLSRVTAVELEFASFMDADPDLLSLCEVFRGDKALIVSASHSGSAFWVAVGVNFNREKEVGVGREKRDV
jgi:hypothetical protein